LTDANRWWTIRSGENTKLRPKTGVTVRAFTNNYAQYITAFDGAIDHVNAGSMPNVHPDGGAGKLLYTGVKVSDTVPGHPVWEVSYQFVHHTTAWNEQCTAEQWHMARVEIPVAYDANGDPVYSWLTHKYTHAPVRTGQAHVAVLYDTFNFSKIDSMCA
jgi:hypothetical protein